MKYLKYVSLVILNWFFPKFSKNITNSYWMKTSKVHSDTSWDRYNFYYSNIKEIMELSGDEAILDVACGTGEIAYLFYKDGFNVRRCDFSDFLINIAKTRFPDVEFYVDNLLTLTSTKEKYDRIFINNAILYLHPKYLNRCFHGLYAALKASGSLYIFDWSDFDKRKNVEGKRNSLLTIALPVYQPTLGGFWYKRKWIKNAAVKSNFRSVGFLDSWTNYRSHAILKKILRGQH